MRFPRAVTLKSGGQSRRERAVSLAHMTTQARRLLAECSDAKCKRRCVDGIAEVRGGFYILCKCAFEKYGKALQFMVEEKERRALGLPGRMGKLIDGKVEVADEVGASLIEKPIKIGAHIAG